MTPDPKRDLLRHCLATLAYRGGKTLRGAPNDFGSFLAAPGTRTPGEILAHIGDLMDWAVGLFAGRHQWHGSTPLPWTREVERFFAGVRALEECLASDAPLGHSAEKLFQGPLADALTHVGQIAMLRRIAGSPVRGESYLQADIAMGRIGPEQAAPVREFD